MDNKFFSNLKEDIQIYFIKGTSHEFSHTERVYSNALKLAEEENIDLDILKAAVLLHDIARQKEDNGEVECHAEAGAKMAEEILNKTDFPKEKIPKVIHAIGIHRHSKNLKADTKEAEILQDADRLDALGAITIGRMFATGGEVKRSMYLPGKEIGPNKKGYSDTTIEGFYNKIFKITPDTFKTKKAQEIAKERYDYVVNFVERFKKEWAGEL